LRKPFNLPYGTARLAAAAINAVLFFIMLFGCGVVLLSGMGNDPVVPEHGGWMAAICLSCVPMFAGHSAFVSFPDAYMLGLFRVPEQAIAEFAAEAQARGATNPWWPALWACALVGLPLGALAVWLVPSLPREQLTIARFVVALSALGAVIAAGTVFAYTGRYFLREAAVPSAARRYPGSAAQYLWRRHVLPQFAANLWLNAWVAPALISGPFSDPHSGIASEAVVGDVFGTGMVLAVAIGMGTLAYARFDQRWLVAPSVAGPALPAWQNVLLIMASPLALALLVHVVLQTLQVEQIHAWPFTLGRALVCGLYSGALALWTGHWVLRTPERAAPRGAPAPGTVVEAPAVTGP
jgi:hypothetical protein